MQKRILVVDDDELNLMMTKRILEKNYDVLLVKSGAEALHTIQREEIDLILLDIAMPGMDGMETFRHIKDYPVEIPVIFLTASGVEDDVMNAINLGAVNYLKKPYYPQELVKRVAKELENK